jgi:glutamyl-Q tRNA(Asp) synthetase
MGLVSHVNSVISSALAMSAVFRFAPSPNGRLHMGHAYSALLNDRMAREQGGRLLLRIEDTDTSRCTPAFADAARDDLHWLGLRFEEPVRVQSQHFADYDAALDRLWTDNHIYPCFCSRKQAAGAARTGTDPDGQPLYGGTCQSLTRAEAEARMGRGLVFGWRLRTRGTAAAPWGDVMIAKRHVGSSYHIAVVVDDALQGVTHVVRGRDLEAATAIHLLLQQRLGLSTPLYHHHDLITDEAGGKLSKSRGSTALASLRADGVTAEGVRQMLGFAGS